MADIDNKSLDGTESFRQFLLSKKNKKITELSVNQLLYGKIDLGILVENGYNHIHSLKFKKGGGITELKNIYKLPGLVKLVINNNELTNLGKLPETMTYIEANHNHLSGEIDLTDLIYLTELHLTHNKITGFTTLPKVLGELHVQHNLIIQHLPPILKCKPNIILK